MYIQGITSVNILFERAHSINDQFLKSWTFMLAWNIIDT
jgi:hypothetical protein